MSLVQVESAISWAVAVANDPQYYYVSPAQPPYGWDCSSFVIQAYRQAGVDVHQASDTSDMISELTRDNVFTNLTFDLSIAQRGDIFMWDGTGTQGHACIYLGNNQIVHAANSTTGIVVATYYPNNYTNILRLTNQTPTSYSWHAKPTGYYDRSSTEAQENAVLIYQTLSAYGWTIEAVAGFLGNVGFESAYNPWRWESDVVIASTDSYNIDVSRSHGYGLCQFTPASKYVWNTAAQSMQNFSPNYSDVSGTPEDGRAQCEFIDQFADYQSTSTWPQTYQQFKQWTGSPEDAASIWIHNYERPASYQTESSRRSEARFWYDFLGGINPPPTRTKRHLPIWLIYKIVRKEF